MIYKASPVITIYFPTNNSKLTTDEILVNFTIERPEFGWLISSSSATNPLPYKSELAYLNVILDDRGIRFLEPNNYLSEPFNYSEKVTNLTDGTHTLRIEVGCQGWDIELHGFWHNQISYEASSENVTFSSDVTAPSISILSPIKNTIAASDDSIPLTFETNEPVTSVSYSLDEKEPIAIGGNITLSELSVGVHNVTVYVTDTFGNMGESETVTFTVKAPQESFSWLPVAAVSGTVVVVVAVATMVYLKKRKAGPKQ